MKSRSVLFLVFVFVMILAVGLSGCAGDVAAEPGVAEEPELVEVAEESEVAEEPEPTEEPEATEEAVLVGDAENGRIIYELGPEGVYEKACTLCHRLTDLGAYAPGFAGVAERAETRVAGLSAEEYLRQSIVDPEAFVVEGEFEGEDMPTTYGELYSEQDIADLIAFLQTQ